MTRLFGIVPTVVLNTAKAENKLFEKRSAYYSHRPSFVSMDMITEA